MKYERSINYYETDAMGIVHHSNYIRFLEEARCFFLDKIGIPYKKIEDEGLMIPVLEVNCKYKHPARYADTIVIDVKMCELKGVRMIIDYTITNKNTGDLILEAQTKHCFTDSNLKPIILKKVKPDINEILEKNAGV